MAWRLGCSSVRSGVARSRTRPTLSAVIQSSFLRSSGARQKIVSTIGVSFRAMGAICRRVVLNTLPAFYFSASGACRKPAIFHFSNSRIFVPVLTSFSGIAFRRRRWLGRHYGQFAAISRNSENSFQVSTVAIFSNGYGLKMFRAHTLTNATKMIHFIIGGYSANLILIREAVRSCLRPTAIFSFNGEGSIPVLTHSANPNPTSRHVRLDPFPKSTLYRKLIVWHRRIITRTEDFVYV